MSILFLDDFILYYSQQTGIKILPDCASNSFLTKMSGTCSCLLRSALQLGILHSMHARREEWGIWKFGPFYILKCTQYLLNIILCIIRTGPGKEVQKNGKMCVHATDESLAEINGLEFFETFSKMMENLHFFGLFCRLLVNKCPW